jgi:hypothetical protein
VAVAPSAADVAMITGSRTRSARLTSAEPSAPVTNPSWTTTVSAVAPALDTPHSARRAGTTADAENHSPMASICTSAFSAS